MSFPNVIVTGHQAFFTREAIGTICATTISSISAYSEGRPLEHEVHAGPFQQRLLFGGATTGPGTRAGKGSIKRGENPVLRFAGRNSALVELETRPVTAAAVVAKNDFRPLVRCGQVDFAGCQYAAVRIFHQIVLASHRVLQEAAHGGSERQLEVAG